MGERLKQAGISSPLVLQNPAEARTAIGAQERFSLSPVHRANYMNAEATRGGVGVVTGVAFVVVPRTMGALETTWVVGGDTLVGQFGQTVPGTSAIMAF